MRALISVYDKEGLIEFASGLVTLGFELVASGGTSTVFKENGIVHSSVEDVTGAAEMLEGRVKTLHPNIHGAILADLDKESHLEDLAKRDIVPFDLVVCNLYPFFDRPGIETIDVGGPTMIRAAAKNHSHVAVVVDPSDYPGILRQLNETGAISAESKRALATKAFELTARYDTAISNWLGAGEAVETLPERMTLTLERAATLRYGENPHQTGARYRQPGTQSWWDGARLMSGMELSYLNIFDTDAAWRFLHEFAGEPAAAIIKHANPCGFAIAASIEEAYDKAFESDPISAFGGIVAINRNVDVVLANKILGRPKADVVIAPSFDEEALKLMSTKRKNTRLISAPAPERNEIEIRSIGSGFLIQNRDTFNVAPENFKTVSKARLSPGQLTDVEIAWKLCARTSSNAIVIVKDRMAIGIGAGQQNRLDSARIAVGKAGDRITGSVAASDAFFPFRDGLDALTGAGVGVVVSPGGSIRDQEVIDAADEAGAVLVFTGERHFRH
ncbi:MAG: bifunctional phosphoribosylaminoimidazolecarboxamide formyltransferase/IMP cyclohydrolase [Actinomycetota bacterium]|nr:MAG: bifunctional phosphoribosylaminoimidazolecarboxamide formyltransferase/IMP cyclohydrolase [Actinomycetota bacterium]